MKEVVFTVTAWEIVQKEQYGTVTVCHCCWEEQYLLLL